MTFNQNKNNKNSNSDDDDDDRHDGESVSALQRLHRMAMAGVTKAMRYFVSHLMRNGVSDSGICLGLLQLLQLPLARVQLLSNSLVLELCLLA